MRLKFLLSIAAISLVSASCNPFAQPTAAGIVKTVNGGADWQFTNQVKGNDRATLQGISISVMAVSPLNREVIYAGSYTEGLYRSEDSGATWSKVLSRVLVYDFVVHPTDDRKIFVAGYFDGFGKVLKTQDKGATWQEVYNEESRENPVRAIAFNPSNPRQIVIGTTSGNVIKTTDDGDSWQLMKNLGDRINRIFWKNGSVYVLTRTTGLYKAAENSSDFTNITESLTKEQGFDYATFQAEKVSTFSQMFIDANDTNLVYITTNRGLYKSSDGGKNWEYLVLPVKPEEASARAIATALTTQNIIYTSIGSTVYKSTDGGKNWQTQKIPATGFVNYLLVDPVLPQITYAGIFAED